MEADRRARGQQLAHPPQAGVGVGHVADPVGHQNAVERAVDAGGGRVHGVAVDDIDARELRAGARHLQHLGRGVQAAQRGLRVDGAQRQGRLSGAAAEVQDAGFAGQLQPFRAPAQVPAVAGVESDQQVVGGGDAVEVGGDAAARLTRGAARVVGHPFPDACVRRSPVLAGSDRPAGGRPPRMRILSPGRSRIA